MVHCDAGGAVQPQRVLQTAPAVLGHVGRVPQVDDLLPLSHQSVGLVLLEVVRIENLNGEEGVGGVEV